MNAYEQKQAARRMRRNGRKRLTNRCDHCDEPSTRPIDAPCPFGHPDCWICWDCYERLTADVPSEEAPSCERWRR